jgi:hypothetical protein
MANSDVNSNAVNPRTVSLLASGINPRQIAVMNTLPHATHVSNFSTHPANSESFSTILSNTVVAVDSLSATGKPHIHVSIMHAYSPTTVFVGLMQS